MAEIFNPSKADPVERNFSTTASASNYDIPRSPISNELMQKVKCGPHNGPNFDAWVHIRDRIVLPCRD